MEIVLSFFIIYILISLFILLNLLFNNNINMYIENKESGEILPPPTWVYLFISLGWIIVIPLMLRKNKE